MIKLYEMVWAFAAVAMGCVLLGAGLGAGLAALVDVQIVAGLVLGAAMGAIACFRFLVAPTARAVQVFSGDGSIEVDATTGTARLSAYGKPVISVQVKK